MANPFDTPIEERDEDFCGPWREPKQMLADQEYGDHSSIHDDETARKLGFKGATIEGPTHFSQFAPLGFRIWGKAWLERGCISASYRAPVFAGDEVRAFAAKAPEGARMTTIQMLKRDGTVVLSGTISIDQDGSSEPTALEARLANTVALAEPVVLRDIAIGMTSPRLPVVMGFDQHMGSYYPFSLADKLRVISEPSPWYAPSGDTSPWGRPIIPLEMVSVLFQYSSAEFEFPVRQPSVGLFVDQEIRLLDGPMFVGEPYEIEREVIALSGTRRTESLWVRTTAYRPGGTEPVATMLLNAGTMKESYARYDAEYSELYGAGPAD